MHPVNPALTLPIAAALALAPATHAEGFRITPMSAVSDPIGFAGAFAGVHAGRLIAGGGANFPDGVMPWDGGKKVWHDRLFSLDPKDAAATWKPAGKLPSLNGYGVSASIREGIVIIGGSDEHRHLAEVFLMTLDESGQAMFKSLPPLPMPLAQMSGAVLGRKLHLCGGITSPTSTNALVDHRTLDFDNLAKGWLPAPPLPGPGRILATAAAVSESFIIAGGCSLAPDAAGKAVRTLLLDAWRFTDGKWSQLPDLPRAAVAAASPAPVMGDSFYVVSGDDGKQAGLPSPAAHQGFTSEVLKCDLVKNRWTSEGNMKVPPPVTLPTAAWENGFVFFNGEVKPGVRTSQVFLFEPTP